MTLEKEQSNKPQLSLQLENTFILILITFFLNTEITETLREISTIWPFQRFSFQFLHSQSLRTGSSWLIKGYTDEDFWKVILFLVISPKIITISSAKLDRKRNSGKFFGYTLRKLIYYQLCKIPWIWSWNAILFQIKVSDRKFKGITLASYFIKVTARPSFRRLRVIIRINRVH